MTGDEAPGGPWQQSVVRAFPALRRPPRQSLGATAGDTIPQTVGWCQPVFPAIRDLPVFLGGGGSRVQTRVEPYVSGSAPFRP